MPSPKAKIDLGAWDEFAPKERANDHEFNLLLSRFNSLCNEVRDYQNLHSDCSVTKAENSTDDVSGDKETNSSEKDCLNGNESKVRGEISVPTRMGEQTDSSKANGEGQSMISLRKKFFQQQQQNPGLPPLPRDLFSKNKKSPAQQLNSLGRSYESPYQPKNNNVNPIKTISQHYNSSHNLTSSTPIEHTNVSIKPEVHQRISHHANSRLSSLSTERLDTLNNNHLSLATSLSAGPVDRPPPLSKPPKSFTVLSPIKSRGSNDLCDDDTIYDAVSPDGLSNEPNFSDRLPRIPALPIHKSHGTSINNFETTQSSSLLNNSLVQNSVNNAGARLPPKNSIISTRVQPPSSFTDPNQDQNSFSSSMVLDSPRSRPKNHNNSSLSLVPNSSFMDQEYGNYVNIDFFLKRSQSPSFDDDGLEESGEADDSSETGDDDDEDDDDDDDEGEDTTQMSHSLSTDQICEDLKQLSPRELAKKLSTVNREDQHVSSASITPASSGDFFDDLCSATATIQNQHSSTASTFRHLDRANQQKFNSFFSSSPQNNEYRHQGIKMREQQGSETTQANALYNSSLSSTTPRDSHGSRSSLVAGVTHLQHQRAMDSIKEGHSHQSFQLKTHTMPPRQTVSSHQESNQHLDQHLFQPHSTTDCNSSSALVEAHTTMRSFLSDLNLSPVDDVFENKAQRRIVKESFAVEFCGRRKLRHLFLFNDVIVCAKYQASSKQKFTFDVKWYLNLNGVTVSDVNDPNSQVKLDLESIENQILAIRTNLMLLRGRMQQIKRSKDKKPSKIIKKLKKKRTELEAELVLLLPHLPLVIRHLNGKKYLFFLSSNFDRNQWIESIKYLQSQLPTSKSSTSSPSSSELQAWIQTCRKNLNPSLGTFLLRSNCDDDLLYGDLYINMNTIKGIPKPGHYYFCFEVDSYGHFSQKASSVVLRIDETDIHELNDEYIFPLDGAHTLRILLYEDLGQCIKPSVVGKAHVELSRSWCLDKPVEREVEFNPTCCLSAHLSYTNSELLSMRIPHAKLCPTFGLDITQVCKKEKTQVPLLIQLCVNEVERRGMREVGIYRMSGTSTDIQRLKKAFETNPYVAELLLRDIDINSVTGFLKTYLREMPEGLFINKMYPKFVAAFNLPQSESAERTKRMIELFNKIPVTNQHTIAYLVDHLVKVNQYESYNKMSLTNLATVLGPNILRPPSLSSSNDTSDPFTAVVIGSMSQAGILYFFLDRKAKDLPLTEMSQSELSGSTEN